jgi:hypothetical protein
MQIFVYTCIRKAMAEMNVMAEMKQKSTMRSILYHFLIIGIPDVGRINKC